MLSTAKSYNDSFEGAYAQMSEDQGTSSVRSCPECDATPQLISRLHKGNGDYHYDFLVVCGCKASCSSWSRKGAIDNWNAGEFLPHA